MADYATELRTALQATAIPLPLQGELVAFLNARTQDLQAEGSQQASLPTATTHKRKREGDDDSPPTHPPSPKKPNAATQSAAAAAVIADASTSADSALLEQIQSMSVPQLKDRLRAHGQLVSGKKDELVERVRDCVLNGCLPECPRCHCAVMKVIGPGWLRCFGSHSNRFYKCGFSASADRVPRTPWKPLPGSLV